MNTVKNNPYLIPIVSSRPDQSDDAIDFYANFWKDTLSRNRDDYGEKFSGDTIVSFNTMAGCLIRMLPEYLSGKVRMPNTQNKRLKLIIESPCVPEELKSRLTEFQNKYHFTIANFMPLLKGELNSLKGFKKYRDCPDVFFEDIRNYYLNFKTSYIAHACNDSSIKQYFNNFGLETDPGDIKWKNFIEKNYLQDFFYDSNGPYEKFIQLRPRIYLPYEPTFISDNEKDACFKQIEIFFGHAIGIIKSRGERLFAC